MVVVILCLALGVPYISGFGNFLYNTMKIVIKSLIKCFQAWIEMLHMFDTRPRWQIANQGMSNKRMFQKHTLRKLIHICRLNVAWKFELKSHNVHAWMLIISMLYKGKLISLEVKETVCITTDSFSFLPYKTFLLFFLNINIWYTHTHSYTRPIALYVKNFYTRVKC